MVPIVFEPLDHVRVVLETDLWQLPPHNDGPEYIEWTPEPTRESFAGLPLQLHFLTDSVFSFTEM